MAEQRVYMENKKSFLKLSNLRKSFWGCAYNKGVPVPFTLLILIDSSLCVPKISCYVCEYLYRIEYTNRVSLLLLFD